MKNTSVDIFLAFGILILFVVSIITPIIVGYDIGASDEDMLNENCVFTTYQSADILNYNCNSEAVTFSTEPTESVSNEKEHSKPISNSNGLMNSSWPMKCHDLRHTSQSPYGTSDNPHIEKWRFKTEWWDGTIESSPVIDGNGVIYFGSMGTDHKLYALYPDGTKKWSYEVGLMIWSTPAIAEDGTIYVASWDHYLHAVNPDGTVEWTFDASDDIVSSPAIGGDGTVYFGTMGFPEYGGCNIFAINPNGTEKWRYQTGDIITSDPAIGNDGTIYIGSCDSGLYAMNPNGSLKWRFDTGGYVKGHPSIADDGTIYFPSWDSYFYAIYPNGTLKWRTDMDSVSSGSAAIADDGTIYLLSDEFRAYYPTNGAIKWSLNVGGSSGHTSPAISSDGTVYTCNSLGRCLIAIDPDGNEIWRKQICNLKADSSPVIAEDGTVYVGSSHKNEGELYSTGYLHAFGKLDPNAPQAPTITGETDGKAGVEYEYIFSSNDPNNNDVYYYIEWGDGEFEDWFGPYPSGEEVVVSHSWDEQDTYTIRARAKDTDNLWGPWGELKVTMPVSQTSAHPWFTCFLERFPNAFPILRRIFRL